MVEYWHYIVSIVVGIIGGYSVIKAFNYNKTKDAEATMRLLENRLTLLENNQSNMHNVLNDLKVDLRKHGDEERTQWEMVNTMNTNTEVISTQLISLEGHFNDMKEVLKDISSTLKKLDNHETRLQLLEKGNR